LPASSSLFETAAAPDAVYTAIADVSKSAAFVPVMTAARRSEADRVEFAALVEDWLGLKA
jgi:hypothetical protein